MLAVGDRDERMMNACAWHSCRLDNNLDARVGDQRPHIISNERRPLLVGIGKRARGVSLVGPACGLELAACA